MPTLTEARATAEEVVARIGAGPGVPDLSITSVHEVAAGWVFFYQSDVYLDYGRISDRLAGNAPILVDRESGEAHVTGTAAPLEHDLAEYAAGRHRCGLCAPR